MALARARPFPIQLKARTLKTLSGQIAFVSRLIGSYGDAVERSRATGQPVRLMVEIAPDGEPKLEQPAADENLADAMAAARERGRLRVAEILAEPDMLSAEEFASLIGTSRVTVNTKRQNHQVLGLEGARRGYRFPRWQITRDGKPFAALPVLFDRLGNSPWAVYRFLVPHHPELDGLTGREALQRGKDKAVIATAESVAQAFA
jgi:hypothetical protein